MKGLIMREWTREDAQFYVDTLREVIATIDEFNPTVPELKERLQDMINLNLVT